jgi:hypothetical protein
MLQELTGARLTSAMRHSRETPALRQTLLDRARWFVFEHFELMLVLLLVTSMLAIHWFVDQKIAFLSFYYLPVIAAGFYLGRNSAVWSAVLIVVLVAFFEAFVGLDGTAAIDARWCRGRDFSSSPVMRLARWPISAAPDSRTSRART